MTLRIISRWSNEVLGSISKHGELTGSPGVQTDLRKIVNYGLNELVRDGRDAYPRTTPKEHPRFLQRIAAYFSRQGFNTEIHP